MKAAPARFRVHERGRRLTVDLRGVRLRHLKCEFLWIYRKRMQHSEFQHELSDRCDPALISIFRRQTPAQKLALLDAMWRSARTLVAAGVRAQHPDWSGASLAQEVAARMSHGAVRRA